MKVYIKNFVAVGKRQTADFRPVSNQSMQIIRNYLPSLFGDFAR